MSAANHIEIPGYDVLYPLNTGGMSTVYLAIQRALERQVAIKVLNANLGNDEHERKLLERRFLLEGRTIAKLPHRNIVAVYDIVSDGKLAYIVMEYLADGSLAARMHKGLSLAEAVSVIVQIAGALGFAHEHGVIHRDLKPANIMFRDGDTPVLTDFGIARQQGVDATRLTQTGMLIGTPTYMSPEQINGLDVDGRADLYSLGILFYELLSGSPPFSGDSPISMLMAHLTQTAAPLPIEVSHFQGLIERMLAKDREQRYTNMREFTSALRSLISTSNTLMLRLRSDPNLSASEQIRALGFINTGEEPVPKPQSTKPIKPSGKASRPQPMNEPANSPASDMEPGEAFVKELVTGRRSRVKPPPAAEAVAATPTLTTARPRHRRYWMVVAPLLLLAAAVGGWFWFKAQAEAEKQHLITAALNRADSLVTSGKIAAPAEDNAVAVLRQILTKNPNNTAARTRLTAIAERSRNDAEQALTRGAPKEALPFIDAGLSAMPDDSALIELRRRALYAVEVSGLINAAASNPARPAPPLPRGVSSTDKTSAREIKPTVDSKTSTNSNVKNSPSDNSPTTAPNRTNEKVVTGPEKPKPQNPEKTADASSNNNDELLALLPDQLDTLWRPKSGNSFTTEFASAERQTGCVAVGFIVEADGHPSSLRVLRSLPNAVYDTQALDTIRGWRFTPTTANSKRQAVYTYALLTYRFGQDTQAQAIADQLALQCKIKSLGQ